MQILKQDINRRILDVARQEFSQRGFAKASMRDIT
ncbi:TetR family transcriptional regulator [Duncaniella muris]|nr:TetR family transcriptional regulator [Duncaniella muris]